MFLLKQFLKRLLLPPTCWILLLLVSALFWNRRWARRLLLLTIALVTLLHFGPLDYALRYPLESRHPPLLDPSTSRHDAIVVLMAEAAPAGGLRPYPTLSEGLFRRLDEARRLYRAAPRPVIVSGGHVDPFTRDRDGNRIARDYLVLWGVPEKQILLESRSRDTFESALGVKRILQERKWKRYLLVTSALHMPRSMLVFGALAPEPIAAPADFGIGPRDFSPLALFPSEGAARGIAGALHEYLGLVNYYWRLRGHERSAEPRP
jgi:uncharacterized SAM-binding protein YcdF (DUF218 family)